MIIAFMGVDGTGKTTIGRAFEKRLNRLGYSTMYRAEFDYFLLRYPLKLLNRIYGSQRVVQMKRSFDRASGSKRLFFLIWPYLVWCDLFIERIFLNLFREDTVVIMDRYAYDFLVGWEWTGYNDKAIRWTYRRFPKPDIGILLDVSPEIAFERKKDIQSNDLVFYRTLREIYLRMAPDLSMKVINTEEPIEVTLDRIEKEFHEVRSFYLKRPVHSATGETEEGATT